ncbi:jg4360 [Pararge aegeria aegeria]|uniref:Jg4360 protein n=1 Tax=Pararge aegeria aegeria TaxID=348720 RepID=A0A8S4RM34_9NEOP|nr:jg4360 [Pararge aegeria aegeria]
MKTSVSTLRGDDNASRGDFRRKWRNEAVVQTPCSSVEQDLRERDEVHDMPHSTLAWKKPIHSCLEGTQVIRGKNTVAGKAFHILAVRIRNVDNNVSCVLMEYQPHKDAIAHGAASRCYVVERERRNKMFLSTLTEEYAVKNR